MVGLLLQHLVVLQEGVGLVPELLLPELGDAHPDPEHAGAILGRVEELQGLHELLHRPGRLPLALEHRP